MAWIPGSPIRHPGKTSAPSSRNCEQQYPGPSSTVKISSLHPPLTKQHTKKEVLLRFQSRVLKRQLSQKATDKRKSICGLFDQ